MRRCGTTCTVCGLPDESQGNAATDTWHGFRTVECMPITPSVRPSNPLPRPSSVPQYSRYSPPSSCRTFTHLTPQPRSREARYRAIFEHANDALTLLSSDGVILEANHRWFDILGVEPVSMVGRHIGEFASPGAEHSNTALYQQYVVGGPARNPIVPLRHANGSTVSMEFSLSTVEIEGRPTVLSIGKDVTEQVRTSDALTAAEAKYRTLIERIPDAIWTCTADGTLTFITRNVSKILGYTAEEMMRETLEARVSWVHPDDQVRMQRSFREHVDHGIPFDIEYRHQRKDEKWIWVRSRGTATFELNGVRYVEGMLSDITERKQLEDSFRQAQKMEAVGQLTGGIAHDFNNLLSTILVNSHFLLTDLAVNDPRRADAEAIKAAADRAAGLTRQLLAFSRKQVLEPTILNLNSAVKDLEKMLCRLIGEDIEFLVIPAADLGSTRVDLSQLEQVVMNLVVNARDAMPAGGKLLMETANVQLDELYVANHAGATPGNYVMLAVSDTGCGMDEATRRRVFEPFFTTKALGKGTGLGMSTCYGIVKQSGGYITVYSEPGHGTVVKVYLPRVDDRPALVTKKSISRSLEGRETILLIEDDPQVRAGASRILKGHGYVVLDASDGTNALAMVSGYTGAPDLVVSDVIMPGPNGPDVVEELRRRFPKIKSLFMSGYTDHAALANGVLQAGVNFLQKPFVPEVLAKRVRDVLDS